MMKKIFNYVSIMFIAVITAGCAACSDWFSKVDWKTVNTITIPIVQTTAQNTVFLVCDKNPDLKPIFTAAGNGILIAVANNQYDTTQIKSYIKQALGDDADKYYNIVISGLDTLIAGYTTFYNLNWKKTDSDTDNANIEAVFSKYLSAIAIGVIDGAKMNKATLAQSNTNTITFNDVCNMQVIK